MKMLIPHPALHATSKILGDLVVCILFHILFPDLVAYILFHSNETEQASLSTGLECGVEQWNGTTEWKMEWISKYTVAADLCN